MKSFFTDFSFVRTGLPLIAIIGLVIAAVVVATDQPDRAPVKPLREPARATGPLANSPRVAGAGIVEPSSEIVDIGTAISGLVHDVRVAPGDFVNRGDVLFVVDPRAARARLGQARAAIEEATAAIREAEVARATAQRQLALYRKIADPAAVSRAELIRAEGEADAAAARRKLATARLAAARAAEKSALTELDQLTVRAPMSGEILAVNIREGEFVSTFGPASQPFIQMGETRPLHVRIDIDENVAGLVKPGADAWVSPRGQAERQIRASFVRSEPLVVPKRSLTNSAIERVDVRVMQLIYRLPDDARDLFHVGQQIDAFIPAIGSIDGKDDSKEGASDAGGATR